MSSVRIEQKGIVSIPADAIVNAANEGLWEGGGVCGAIFAKAGSAKLTEACNKIGHCDTGSAVITPAFGCPAKFIIHAVGPVWRGGTNGEAELLYGAYKRSLELCKQNDLHSVVFPLISAGIFGYPLKEAWKQATYACKNFLEKNMDYDLDIIFAIPEDEKVKEGNNVLQEVLKSIECEEKQIRNSEGILLYEGITLYGKPYGYGKTFFENGNVYQEGKFGIKGLLKGKEYYPNGKIRFDGEFGINGGYGPNFPTQGKCYDEEGKLYYEGEIQTKIGGVGWRTVKVPKQYGAILQENRPSVEYFIWEDEAKLKSSKGQSCGIM